MIGDYNELVENKDNTSRERLEIMEQIGKVTNEVKEFGEEVDTVNLLNNEFWQRLEERSKKLPTMEEMKAMKPETVLPKIESLKEANSIVKAIREKLAEMNLSAVPPSKRVIAPPCQVHFIVNTDTCSVEELRIYLEELKTYVETQKKFVAECNEVNDFYKRELDKMAKHDKDMLGCRIVFDNVKDYIKNFSQ